MDYLAIIRKADFVDLFKYGKLNVFSAISFDGNIRAHANDNGLFEKLTKVMNLFEYSFEYMIIHFISDKGNKHLCSVNIENVKGLYTFDEVAKKEMSVSFDSRIKLQVSPWSEKFKALYNNRLMMQSKRGIDNLWTIFELSETNRKMCESIITDDIVSEVFDEMFSYKRPVGEQSIWTYLLRYERHSFYPKNTKGYFYDYIHVACNWMAKKEIQSDVAIETTLCNLIKICPATDFKALSQIAINSNLPSRTDKIAKCQFAVAAPLFLLMKDKFSSGFFIDWKTIDYAKKFGFECSVAIYLLGLTLGYDKTYNAYYDFVKIPIFELPIENQKVNKLDYSQKSEEKEIHSENKVDKKQQIAWLRKNKKNLEPAFNDEDIMFWESKGYKIAKRFKDEEKSYIISQGYNI